MFFTLKVKHFIEMGKNIIGRWIVLVRLLNW